MRKSTEYGVRGTENTSILSLRTLTKQSEVLSVILRRPWVDEESQVNKKDPSVVFNSLRMTYKKRLVYTRLAIAILIVFLISTITLAKPMEIQQPRYRPAAVPIFNYSSDNGFGFGFIAALYDYLLGEMPYNRACRVKLLITTKLKQHYYFFFDNPHIFDTNWRLDFTTSFESLKVANYFGIGNDTVFDKTILNASDSNFISYDYYHFKRITPSFDVNLVRPIGWNFNILLGYHFLYSFKSQEDLSLLNAEAPLGSGDNRISYVKTGIILDWRDREAAPRNGSLTELSADFSTTTFGSSYNFIRVLFNSRNYIELFKHMVLTNRIVLKTSYMDIPFYELSNIGGYKPFEGLGGEAGLRGYPQNRFIDKVDFVVSGELRYDIATVGIQNQIYDWTIIAFVDSGRVFPSITDFRFKDFHLSTGGGLSMAWNRDFVIRGDIAWSPEQIGVYIGFGHIF